MKKTLSSAGVAAWGVRAQELDRPARPAAPQAAVALQVARLAVGAARQEVLAHHGPAV